MSPSEIQQTTYQGPVSVMEDRNVDKSGVLEISIIDIEDTRNDIYELTRKYEGYIFYEQFTTVNSDQHALVIKIALYNNYFLDYFNEVRDIGLLVSSQIQASLDEPVQQYNPGTSETVEPALRTSTLVINLTQSSNLGNYMKVVLRGLLNVLNVALPILTVLIISLLIITGLYFLYYVTYYGLILKYYDKIKRKFRAEKIEEIESNK